MKEKLVLESNILKEDITGDYLIVEPDNKTFFLKYALFIPDNYSTNTNLIVNPCNTGYRVCFHLNEAEEEAESISKSLDLSKMLSFDLKLPVLIPLIPRISGYYTQSLSSDVYHNNFDYLIESNEDRLEENKLSESEIEEIKRILVNIPEQVVAMIKHATCTLNTYGIKVNDKVIIEGYSASSKFANLFTALYPSRVSICIAGGISGINILPIKEFKGKTLNYPIGINDVPNFDLDAFTQVKHFYYQGTNDNNDPASPKLEYELNEDGTKKVDELNKSILKLDDKGKTIPILDEFGSFQSRYKENYSDEVVNFINKYMGRTNQERLIYTRNIYEEYKIDAIFKEYNGTHLTFIFPKYYLKNTTLVSDIEEFIKRNIKND